MRSRRSPRRSLLSPVSCPWTVRSGTFRTFGIAPAPIPLVSIPQRIRHSFREAFVDDSGGDFITELNDVGTRAMPRDQDAA